MQLKKVPLEKRVGQDVAGGGQCDGFCRLGRETCTVIRMPLSYAVARLRDR